MPNVYGTVAVPENLLWWGWGREGTPGTVVAPTISMPLEKGFPDDKITELIDKNLRGFMGEDYNMILGTEIVDLPVSGDVYLDTIGNPLLNMFGDYQATGSTPTSSTTLNGAVTAGATTVTVAAIGTISATAPNNIIQISGGGAGQPSEVVNVLSVSVNTITLASGLRFSHNTGATVAIVAAPFTHTFALLNGNGANGQNIDAQPATHTITYHNNLTASQLARQYAYWCCSGIDFKMNSEQLFSHDTKGMSVLGVAAGSAVTNSQSAVQAIPNWQFKVGIGGPASGGTLVNNVLNAEVNWARGLKSDFGLNGQQAPYIIARLGMSVTGKLTFLAQDESPFLAYLGGTQQQLQISMNNGLSGAAQLGCTFNFSKAQYEKAVPSSSGVLQWDVDFRGLMNSTDVGATQGMGMGTMTLINAISTY